MITERAPAKVNLVLHVGAPRPDGLHPLASIFASLDLADTVTVDPAERDEVVCPGVEGENLAARAIAAFRAAAPGAELAPLRITIEKRIPVAAGMAGGSADAAAALRAANTLAGEPLAGHQLAALAGSVGSDVPSRLRAGHSLVQGVGELVEPLDLPAMALVLLPQVEGLSTPAVFAELDRLGSHTQTLDPAPLRALAGASLVELAAGLANDLEPAALSLRPELAAELDRLRDAGALAARVTGSGPTCFGLFEGRADADRAAAQLGDTALVAELEP